MQKVFIFDLDDTLMWNEYTYSLAFSRFYAFLMRLWKHRLPYIGSVARLAEDITAQMVNETNPKTGKPYGFIMDGFPASLVRCYQELCQMGYGAHDNNAAQRIYTIGMTAFDPKHYKRHGLAPGAKKVLDFILTKKDELILITKGDANVQQRKIDALGLNAWFEEILIVESKPPALFEEIKKRFPRQQIFSVGNSFSSDIKPAIASGVKGIFIPYYTWKVESIDCAGCDPSMILTITSIKEIIRLYKDGELEQKMR